MVFDLNQKEKQKEKRQDRGSVAVLEPIVNLGPVMRYLSQSKGKLEIAFQKNENPAYESLCLVFIKIPIYGAVIDVLRTMIEKEGSNKIPLSKGKLSIDTKEVTLFAFVGAIRIKSIDKSGNIILSVIEKMRGMLKNAIEINKRTSTTTCIPLKEDCTIEKVRKAPRSNDVYDILRKKGVHTFSDEEKEEFRRYDELLDDIYANEDTE